MFAGFIGNVLKIKRVVVAFSDGGAAGTLAALFLGTNAVRSICPVGILVPAYGINHALAVMTPL